MSFLRGLKVPIKNKHDMHRIKAFENHWTCKNHQSTESTAENWELVVMPTQEHQYLLTLQDVFVYKAGAFTYFFPHLKSLVFSSQCYYLIFWFDDI